MPGGVIGPKRTVSRPEYCFAAFSKAAHQRLPEQHKGDNLDPETLRGH